MEKQLIGVTSIDKKLERSISSNIWSTNDISAPGVEIFSCYKDKSYSLSNGTSMAAAHISGIIALGISLLKEKGYKVNVDDLENILKQTANPLSHGVKEDIVYYNLEKDLTTKQAINWFYGSGLVIADKFVEKVYTL